MMIHASQGGEAASFDWRRYSAERVSRGRQPVDSWFTPTASVQRAVDDILARGVFEKVTIKNRGLREGSRGSVVRAKRWTGYRLQKAATTRHKLSLAPFDVRVSREESAVRLAVEADETGKPWYRLAAVRSGTPAATKPGDGRARIRGSKRLGNKTELPAVVHEGRVTRAAALAREAAVIVTPPCPGEVDFVFLYATT